MSGGSLDYAYGKLDDAISQINIRAKSPLHKAFAKHLVLVSEALREIEWVFSGDHGPDGADASIKKVLSNPVGAQMEIIRDELNALIAEAKKVLEETK